MGRCKIFFTFCWYLISTAVLEVKHFLVINNYSVKNRLFKFKKWNNFEYYLVFVDLSLFNLKTSSLKIGKFGNFFEWFFLHTQIQVKPKGCNFFPSEDFI